MPYAIALRSFDHQGRVLKGDDLSGKFDIITLRALKRSGLISLDEAGAPDPVTKVDATKAPVATVGALGKPAKGKAGKKSAASPAAPASPEPTLPPSTPGDLPPPLPVE